MQPNRHAICDNQTEKLAPLDDIKATLEVNAPAIAPLLVDITSLSQILARSIPALERDTAAGRIPRPLRLGRSKRWRFDEIREWVAAGMPSRREWETRRRT